MAITLNNLQPQTHGFAVNGYSADMSGCEELLPAPGLEKAYALRQVVISCITAIDVTIGQGENAAGTGVQEVILGPVLFNNLGGSADTWVFVPSIMLEANRSLTIDASGAGVVQVFVQGTVEKRIYFSSSSSSSSFSSSSFSSSCFSSSSSCSSSFSSSSSCSSCSSSFSSASSCSSSSCSSSFSSCSSSFSSASSCSSSSCSSSFSSSSSSFSSSSESECSSSSSSEA